MELHFALEIRLELGLRMHIPVAEGYTRGAVLIRSGVFHGPGLSGTLVEGSGGDFPLVRHDGGGRFESQYLLRTDDGAVILKRSAGVRHADPAIIGRLMAGEDLPPDAYYMRMTPRFEAPAGPYAWLNSSLFVGVGWRHPHGSQFRFWRVV